MHDLTDDAIMVRELSPQQAGGQSGLELTVHIADVAHYVRPHTALDREARRRAETNYLVHKVKSSSSNKRRRTGAAPAPPGPRVGMASRFVMVG